MYLFYVQPGDSCSLVVGVVKVKTADVCFLIKS